MTDRRFRNSVLLLGLGVLLSGCHFFDDPSDVDAPLDACPMNWGYPCPCDAINYGVRCGDGSVCLYHTDPTRGFCSPECTEVGGTQECLVDNVMIDTYGVLEKAAVCANIPALSPNAHCLVICEYYDSEGQCPPGSRCDIYLENEEGVKACFPSPKYPTTEDDLERQQSCMGYCDKTDRCYDELNRDPSLTYNECKAICIHSDWHADLCGGCLIGCNAATGASCTEFIECQRGCPCNS